MTARVIFNHDAISVRRALVVFIDVDILVLLTFISRHEFYFFLFVTGEYSIKLPRYMQLIKCGIEGG